MISSPSGGGERTGARRHTSQVARQEARVPQPLNRPGTLLVRSRRTATASGSWQTASSCLSARRVRHRSRSKRTTERATCLTQAHRRGEAGRRIAVHPGARWRSYRRRHRSSAARVRAPPSQIVAQDGRAASRPSHFGLPGLVAAALARPPRFPSARRQHVLCPLCAPRPAWLSGRIRPDTDMILLTILIGSTTRSTSCLRCLNIATEKQRESGLACSAHIPS